MNLTLHQFRKDVRQFHLILIVWGVLLFLDLAANLGWVGSGKSSLQWGEGAMANFVVWLQDLCLWLLFFLIPTALVLTDSPAHREGFLRTRPVSGRDLWLAKALFVLVLVILPVVIQEAIYLALAGLPAGYVLHGVGDRLLYGLPMVVIVGAFASLWRGYSQWAGGLTTAFGGTIVISLLLNIILYFAGHPDLFDNTTAANASSVGLAATYVYALAALAVALLHARFVWGPRGRWLGIAAALLAYIGTTMYWPWNLVNPRPADPAAAQAVVTQFPLNVPAGQISLSQKFGKEWDNRLDFDVFVKPEVNRGTFPNLVEWHGRQVQLVSASGQSFPPVHPPVQYPDQRGWNNPPLTDLRIWIGLLPQEVYFRLNQNVYPFDYQARDFGEFKADPQAAWLHAPVTLKTQAEGRVFRWEQVGDFALNAPATHQDAYGSWTFLELRANDFQHQDHVLVKRSQISFSTATDARATGFGNDPRDRYDFVIYNPRRKVALVTQNSYISPFSTRARATALSQYWLDLVINDNSWPNWKPYTREELTQCRLLIFEKTWLGTVPADWQSPGFVINDLLTSIPPVQAQNQEGLSRGEMERRLAELPFPDPAASREEVCHYLVQAVPIMDASRFAQVPGEAVVARLATLVPDHLDVLLAGLPAMGTPASSAVIEAIIQGATEPQRSSIIAALPSEPGLVRVLFQRGWLTGAKEAVCKLMNATQPLSQETIEAIASYQDPATYPRLLSALEADPRPDTYDLLRPLPGIAAPLAATVDRLWQNHDRIVPSDLTGFAQPLGLALHTGNRDALRFAFRLLGETVPTRNGNTGDWQLAQVFRDNLKLDGLKLEDLGNNQRVFAWLRHYESDSFVFDPIRQRFVLRP